MAGLQQLFRPFAVTWQHGLGLAAQTAAAMERDHGGKRAVTIGLVELGMQGQTGRRDIDLVRSRQRRGTGRAVRSEERQE